MVRNTGTYHTLEQGAGADEIVGHLSSARDERAFHYDPDEISN